MRLTAVLGLILLLVPSPLLAQDMPTLAMAIEGAVDAADPAARAEAARQVMKRPDATVPNVLAAMKGFGRFGARKAGIASESVALFDGKKSVPAEVHVYTPAGYDPAKAAAALLALHDSGGNGKDEIGEWKAVADRLGMIVVAPTDAHCEKGYAFTAEERESALSALRWARRRWNVDENRVFGTGASRGGHLVWDIALRRPDVFAAIAPVVGGPRLANGKGENNFRYLENLRRMPIRDLQGMQDDARLIDSLQRVFQRLGEFENPDAKMVEFPELGHAADLTKVDWVEWLGKAKRDVWPEEVVRRSAEPGEARNLWVETLALGKGAVVDFKLAVDVAKWNAMSDAERREAFIDRADACTARLRVRRKGPGVFDADGREVEKFRILLPEGSFEPDKPVTVKFRGKDVKVVPKPDPKVLLGDFVERFDRTFLPVAEVRVP